MFFKKNILLITIFLLLMIVCLAFYANKKNYFLNNKSSLVKILVDKKEYKVFPDDSIVDAKDRGLNFPGVDLDVYSIANEKILPNEDTLNINSDQVDNEIKEIIEYSHSKDTNNTNSQNNDILEKKFKYFVQLASFKYKKQAEDLQKDFLNYEDKIFKNLNYTISLVDVKNRGIYFRLMAGPFQTKLKASQVCENMKKKSISCITIKEF